MLDPLLHATSAETIAARNLAIRQTILRESKDITSPNFNAIANGDLALLFNSYDQHHFEGTLARLIQLKTSMPITFRLSPTMTSAGGKTITTWRRGPGGSRTFQFQIAIAVRMLFDNFNDAHRTVSVGGLICNDRLEALGRIMEHEIVHLYEMLLWDQSSCAAPRFKTLVHNLFGHLLSHHQLVTPREMAAVAHGIHVGSRVEFEYDGATLSGIVNRISRRATVLVESPEGQPYRNGKRYVKYYIPLPFLRAAALAPQGSA